MYGRKKLKLDIKFSQNNLELLKLTVATIPMYLRYFFLLKWGLRDEDETEKMDILRKTKVMYEKCKEQWTLKKQLLSKERDIEDELRRLRQWKENQLQRLRDERNAGLSSARIELFEHFVADETLNGEMCVCCLNDWQVGKVVVKLDCSHLLCKTCTVKWFSSNKTCPTCRRLF